MALDQVDVEEYNWEGGELVPKEEVEMSFMDHLEELRWHVIRSLIAIAIGGIVLFVFRDWYFNKIILGPASNDFASYAWFCELSQWAGAGETLCMTLPEFKIQAVNFAEQFITGIKLSFIGGFVLAFPYVFYEIWKFVSPGLYSQERKATRGIIIVCSLLFFTGVLFGFFIVAPFATNFLMSFNVSGQVSNNPTLSSFVLYMVMFTLPAGIIFELPIVVYFLAKLGLVTAGMMRQYRRHAIIGILMLSAILTPPDVVTQFLIGIPLYFLYEISIFIAARMEKKYQQSLQ
jgi:sec-independent protein translocase protein TatC